MKAKWMMAAAMACMVGVASAQQNTEEAPRGKATVQVFANFHTGFGAENDDRGFALDRSYLGYEYTFSNGLSVKGLLDVGQSSEVDDYHRIAYVKSALVSWKHGNLTLSGGLIPTTQFNYQEKFWGYRYIQKSFQDLYKFGHSADLGISAAYRFTSWLVADALIVNGEGYKKIQLGDGLNYGLGLTFTPVKGLSMRLYGGVNEAREEGEKSTQNVAAFVGYRHDKFRIGAEYNAMWNTKFEAGKDQSGWSLYGAVKLSSFADLYARYDEQASSGDWNRAQEESAALLGAEFRPCKYVKLAPNFRMTMPKAAGAENSYAFFLSCYFGF